VTPIASKRFCPKENPGVTGSFLHRPPPRVALAAIVVAFCSSSFALEGCGDLPPPPAATPGASARTAPDDSDAWNLVPRTASSLVDLDMVALRGSPWSRALVTGGFVEDREERQRSFGYDVFNDADRVIVAGFDAAGLANQPVVVVGRFEAARVGRAFLGSVPGAAETRWRDCPIWEGAGRAVAVFPSGRTLVQGTPETARAAIDAAWGVVPDARGGPLGALARDVDAEAHRPAVTVALLVTDDMRARAAGLAEVPPELRRVVARLDLGADLELTGQAVFDDGARATTSWRLWTDQLRELKANRMLRLMGLGPVVDGAQIQPSGARVHGRLRIPEERREALSERVLLLLKAVAQQRGQASPQP
jgi:hypothetical protein